MHSRVLTAAERRDWLRLIRSENVGPVTFYRLLERFSSATAALDALPELARRAGRQAPLKAMSRGAAETELAALEAHGARLLASCEPDYPRPLAAIEDAPPVIAVIGHIHLLHRPAVAMVGARNASLGARQFARELAAALGERGYTIVSGLARGIDAAAHEGALATGTAGVVAGGIDIVYPAENRALHQALEQQGVILAESPFGTQPQARHFPRRNRLVSGLCLGTLVVEAALKSGSLITASMALEQGREVFAVPGSPRDPRAGGTNDLLRQGAHLTEHADDVDGILRPLIARPLGEPEKGWLGAAAAFAEDGALTPQLYRRLMEALSPAPVAVDELIRDSQLSASIVQAALTDLELAGLVERHAGSRVSLR
ncbi:DNA-processing protein DprA [Radicibacter daui]|uniref:DNA-processing protein DprA n=1 Tax=Radicibacter daui TaxID=3064829 RepID=UPI004046FE86